MICTGVEGKVRQSSDKGPQECLISDVGKLLLAANYLVSNLDSFGFSIVSLPKDVINAI